MAKESKGNAGSASPSGSVAATSENTPRHKLLAMGQQPKDGAGSKPGK